MKKSKKSHNTPAPDETGKNLMKEPESVYYTKFSKGINTLPSIASFLGKGMPAAKDIDSIINRHQYISIIREGVTFKTMEHLMQATGITSAEMASILHTSERTLRRYTSETVLNPEQTERVVELARLYTRGSEVFGALQSFKDWMNSTIMALGNIKPKELLDTSLGIEILQEELGRIEHGIFA